MSKDLTKTRVTCRECEGSPELMVASRGETRLFYWDKKQTQIHLATNGILERSALCYYHRKKAAGLFDLNVEDFRAQHKGETCGLTCVAPPGRRNAELARKPRYGSQRKES